MSYIEILVEDNKKKKKNKDDEMDGIDKDSSETDFSDIKDGEEL